MPRAVRAGLERYQLASRFTAFVVTVAREAGEQAQTLPELRAVPQMLAAGWGGMGLVGEPRAMACRPELTGASHGLDHLDMAAFGDVSDTGAFSPRRAIGEEFDSLSLEGELAGTPAIPATLDAATVERLLEAVGRGWVPADLEDLERAGCPSEVIREILLGVIDNLALDLEEVAVLWLAVLVQSVDPKRLDPPASPRYAAALGDRRWRGTRRVYQGLVGRQLGATA